jgi:hypothetical protein
MTAYLFKPTVGDAPGWLSGIGAVAETTVAPLIRRSVACGELVSTLPVATKSVTSAGYYTGLSV